MKILKTVKGKIIAGTVVVGLFGGAGFALANTDAGEQLRVWYDSAFNQAKADVLAANQEYVNGQIPSALEDYNAMKDGAATDINSTRDEWIAASLANIDAAKLSHIESLDAEKQAIITNMNERFYNEVFLKGYFDVLNQATIAQQQATDDLSAFTSTTSNAALTQVTEQLTAAKETAIADLEEAIRQAQEELITNINSEASISERNLQNWTDNVIEDTFVVLEEILATQVAEQQTIIANAAQQLETDAIAELDDVVSGIGSQE